MKTEPFRSAAFWKAAIMSMPDNSFYELMRSVFGKIKTPFNKQKLTDDLSSFLMRSDIQKTITEYIDKTDAKIIAAAAALNEPMPEQLEYFFSGEISGAQLQDIIVNLEERFILYRVSENRLSLNPVLEQVLLPFIENTSDIFPAVPAVPANDESSIKTKKQANLISSVLRQTPEAILMLGLYYIDSGFIFPDEKRLNEFKLQETGEQNELICAALIIYNEETKIISSRIDILPPLYRGKIRETANLIHSLLESLKSEYNYPEKTLKRMIDVLKTQTGAYCVKLKTDEILKTLRKTNLIKKTKTPDTAKPNSADTDNTQQKKIISKFHSILDKTQLNAAEKNELSARIDRKLVLCESQLKNADIRYEKLEARLMDYAGKQNIAKQAVSGSSPVEIIFPDRGREKQIFGIPKALEKENEKLIMVIDNHRIPLAKIILIRKIKKSIFEI